LASTKEICVFRPHAQRNYPGRIHKQLNTYCIYMYINSKMIPIETPAGIGGEEDKGDQRRR
jgi:hypothetical protein